MKSSTILAAAALQVLGSSMAWAQDGADDPFTMIVIPDPQGYTQVYPGFGQDFLGRFHEQMDWIIANQSASNTRLVVNIGDCVEHYGAQPAEWSACRAVMNKLHPNADPMQPPICPYVMCLGNHDFDTYSSTPFTGRVSGTNTWTPSFGPTRFEDFDWYGGDDRGHVWSGQITNAYTSTTGTWTGKGLNNYAWMIAAGRKFLVLNLEMAAPDYALDWAQGVIDAHPKAPVIVVTHAYLRQGSPNDLVELDGMKRPYVGNSGQQIWDKFIRINPTIFLVLSGHTGVQWFKADTNIAGQTVYQQMVCYTLLRLPNDHDRNGAGWLWRMRFDPASETIACRAYSTVHDQWATNSNPPPGQSALAWPPDSSTVAGLASDYTLSFDWDARIGPPVHSYGTSKVNSQGTLAQLSYEGLPEPGGTFRVTISGGLPNRPFTLLQGFGAASVPWLGGTLLIDQPFKRLVPSILDSNGQASLWLGPFVDPSWSGKDVYFQAFYRDEQDPFQAGLSDGLKVRFD